MYTLRWLISLTEDRKQAYCYTYSPSRLYTATFPSQNKLSRIKRNTDYREGIESEAKNTDIVQMSSKNLLPATVMGGNNLRYP
jgi:hypothetical protein